MTTKTSLKIAGVTFSNPDGENRQEILKGIGKGWKTFKLVPGMFTDPETGKSEKCIRVYEKNTRKQVGFIAKKDLNAELAAEKTLSGFVGEYKGKYHIEVSAEQKPSSNAYWTVKTICQKNGYVMPSYDKRAYAEFFGAINKFGTWQTLLAQETESIVK